MHLAHRGDWTSIIAWAIGDGEKLRGVDMEDWVCYFVDQRVLQTGIHGRISLRCSAQSSVGQR
jgi:hypothetical protein